MFKKTFYSIALSILFCSNSSTAQNPSFYTVTNNHPKLTQEGAAFFANLPLKCLDKEFPYKTGITFSDNSLVVAPINYHPAFYGCFDWHSSVHGHWMLVRLLKTFPALPQAEIIKTQLTNHLSAENIAKELAIFRGDNKSFERIYGWGWLLQLQNELLQWNDPWTQQISQNLQPLASYFSSSWITFLSKLAYPIRVGEHSNLAFGLSLSWDYAVTAKDTALQSAIRSAAMRFYATDKNAPANYEPSGYDFLSPSLEEADLMRRVLPKASFAVWLKTFLPQLFTNPDQLFKIAVVNDRSDGKLVHLDGLNLSRSWCLNGIAAHLPTATASKLKALANKHLEAALPNVASGDYMGEHWLASFVVYAMGM
jgi:hypothetical protein